MSDARKLISSSGVAFIGSFLSGALSYVFNLFVARKLGPTFYSDVTSILSLLTIAGVGGSAITIVAMSYAGDLYFSKQQSSLRQLHKILTGYSLLLAGVIFLVGIIFLFPVIRAFSIDEPLPVILALLSLFFTFASVVNRGMLQGTQRFWAVSFSAISEMLGRVLIFVLITRLGGSPLTALMAVLGASALGYLATFPAMYRLLKGKGQKGEKGALFQLPLKSLLKYAWQTLLMSLFLNVLLSLDILLVKRYFPDQAAGQYAAVSTVAKIIFFFTAPVVSVMFPMIAEKRTNGEKHYKTLLFSIILSLVVGAGILAAYTVIPGRIIQLLYGSSYVALAYLLPAAGLYVVFYTLVNLLANYFIAVRDFFFLYLFGGILVVQIGIAHFYHPSIPVLLSLFISTTGLLFALMGMRYAYLKRNQLITLLSKSYV